MNIDQAKTEINIGKKLDSKVDEQQTVEQPKNNIGIVKKDSDIQNIKTLNTIEEKSMEKPKMRCGTCRKKLTVSTFMDCKCGGIYCSEHRYADKHECKFNHKAVQQQNLAKTLIKLSSNKLEQI